MSELRTPDSRLPTDDLGPNARATQAGPLERPRGRAGKPGAAGSRRGEPGSRRRRFGRLVGLLLPATLLGANAAHAQSVTLVSNTGQTAHPSAILAVGASGQVFAQSFTTGDNSAGYTLASVRVYLSDYTSSSATPRVSIYNAEMGNPGSSEVVLANPGTLSNFSFNTFTAPAGTTLAGGTTYFVVVEAVTGGFRVGATNSNGEDSGAQSGWSIADAFHAKSSSLEWNAPLNFPLRIAVNGVVRTTDTTAPTFMSAEVDGDELVIRFNETLIGSKTPAASAFAVLAADSAVTVSTVTVSGATVTLRLATAVAVGDTVTVAYTKPTSGDVLQDLGANEVATFSAQPVTNDTDFPGVTLTVNPASVREDADATEVTVTATLDEDARTVPTVVTVSVVGGSARVGRDYAAVPDLTVTIPADSTSGSGTFTLTPIDDDFGGRGEMIRVTGTAAGVTVTGTELTITDDETLSTDWNVTWDPSSLAEEGGEVDVTLTFTLNADPFEEPIRFWVSVGNNGDPATHPRISGKPADYTTSVGNEESIYDSIPAGSGSTTVALTITPVDDNYGEGPEILGIYVTCCDPKGRPPDLPRGSQADLTIIDDERISTRETLTVVPDSVDEDGDATEVTVTAELNADARQFATPVSVKVGAAGDGATEGTDYATVTDFTVTIDAGSTTGSGTFTLTPTDDNLAEGDETLSLTGTRDGLETVTGTQLTITDDETASTAVTLTVAPTSVREDASATTVTVTATLDEDARASATSVTVAVGSAGDGATEGTDYATVSDLTVTIAAGATSGTATFTLTPTDDSLGEGNEQVSVTGTADGLTVTGTALTITDDETVSAGVTLTVAPASVDESAAATEVTVTATLDGAARADTTEVMVAVGATTDGATEGTDYATVSDLTVTIAAGATSGTATFTLTPTDDSLGEGSEQVSVTGTADGLTVTGTALTITDDETVSTEVTLSVNPASVREDAGGTTVTVTAELDADARPAETAVTVAVGAAGDGAAEGTDYAAVPDFTVTIAAGSTTGSGTFTLTPTDDNLAEGDETLSLTGSAGGLAVTGTALTIADDETVSTGVTLSVTPESVREDAGGTTVTVTAELDADARPSATPVTVAVGSTSDAATEGTDYAAVPDLTVTIAAGSTSGTGTFTLTPTDDSLEEGHEQLSVTGTAGGLAVTGTALTIRDDETIDPGPRVEITFEDVEPPRDAYDDGVATGPFTTRIRFSERVEGFTREDIEWQTIYLTTVDTTRIGLLLWDYAEVRTGLEYTVRMMPDQNGRLDIFVPRNAARSVGTGTGTQTGDGSLRIELPPNRVMVEPRTLSVAEGDGEGAKFVVLLTSAPTGTVRATVSGMEGTDVAVDRPAWSFGLPYWSGGRWVKVTAGRDADATDEAVTLTVRTSGGGYDGRVANVAVNVRDAGGGQQTPPDPLTASVVSSPERHDGENRFGVRIDFSEPLHEVGASTLRDHAFSAAGGEVTAARQVDGSDASKWEIEVEPAGTDSVTLTLAASPGCGQAHALCTADGRRLEKGLELTVPGPEPAPEDLTATLADAPSEHDGSSPFGVIVSFSEEIQNSDTLVHRAASATTGGTVTSSTRHEDRSDIWRFQVEPDGHGPVTFVLSGGGTCAGSNSAVLCTSDGRVLSNDVSATVRGPAGVSAADAEATEGTDAAATFTVSLSRPALAPVTVDYATGDGTAAAGEDYGAASGTLTFSIRQRTKTVSVRILDDGDAEDEETFTLTLSNASNGYIEDGTATGTIRDDDDGARSVPAVSVADASAAEGDSVAFTVSLSAASDEQVTVDYATSGGTATSGTDFTAASGTLAFDAGETSKTVSVATTEDSDDEEDETFTLTLSSPANATLGDAAATGTIEDDDAAAPLTATFADMPSTHAGDPFTFGLAFSEEFDLSYKTLRDDAFDVTGGSVAGASRREQGSNRRWTITVEPASASHAVTVTLPATTDCNADGAICTGDGRPLSNSPSATVEGEVEAVPAVSVTGASAAEGDPVAFTVSLSAASDEQVTVDYATSGGTATAGDDFTAVSGTLAFGANETSKTVSVATTDDSDAEEDETFTLTLSSPANATLGNAAATGTIEDDDDAAAPLTARFADMPSTHAGDPFTFALAFSEEFSGLSYKTLRDSAFAVTGGSVTGASRRTQGSNRAWNITVDPASGTGAVTIELPRTTDCAASGAICTEDGRPLSNSPSDTVAAAASASLDDGAGGEVAIDDALAVAAGLTPDEARAALLGERTLSEARLAALDRLGNRNGRYDLGDVLSWIERCRRGGTNCGTTSPDSVPPASAVLLAAAAARPGRRRGKRPRRRRRRARLAGRALALLLAATAWSCTGDLVGPPAGDPAARTAEVAAPAADLSGPGLLSVEWNAPPGRRDIGVLLELEGPAVASVHAPGLELYWSGEPGRLRIIVAGSIRAGPLVRFRVPDRAELPLYRVRVLEVTGEDFGLRDAGEYRAAITAAPDNPGRDGSPQTRSPPTSDYRNSRDFER